VKLLASPRPLVVYFWGAAGLFTARGWLRRVVFAILLVMRWRRFNVDSRTKDPLDDEWAILPACRGLAGRDAGDVAMLPALCFGPVPAMPDALTCSNIVAGRLGHGSAASRHGR